MQQEIEEAIRHLKDAAANEQINKKSARAHVIQATNILTALLGLPSVGPDPDPGPQTKKSRDPEGETGA